MLFRIIRTDSSNPDFIGLVRLLDAELHARFQEEQAFFDQFNKLDSIKHVVVAYDDDIPVGCGAIKRFDEQSMEVKRMFVSLGSRGQGVAARVLTELETWAREMNFSSCILETGARLHEAVALYKKGGYKIFPNYGQYAASKSSICMKKVIA